MAKHRREALIITCEHGGNRVPRELAAAFRPIRGTLATHRGWDPGALQLARQFASRLPAPLHFSTISRLVVDLNRSESHPRFFSRVTAGLEPAARERLVAQYYRPFRDDVFRQVKQITQGRTLVNHVSVHSFTPILKGVRRSCHIGMLFDPSRSGERQLAQAWQHAIRSLDPGLVVRMNYPYRGTSDGHTTSLRGCFQADSYIGIELEINQSIVRAGSRKWAAVRSILTHSLAAAAGREAL